MPLTADVKEELATILSGKTTVRAAELATILRFSGRPPPHLGTHRGRVRARYRAAR